MSPNSREVTMQKNEDGTWSEAIPLPFYGIKKKCSCGKSFWKESNYERHYRQAHTDGKKYVRTPKGFYQAKGTE